MSEDVKTKKRKKFELSGVSPSVSNCILFDGTNQDENVVREKRGKKHKRSQSNCVDEQLAAASVGNSYVEREEKKEKKLKRTEDPDGKAIGGETAPPKKKRKSEIPVCSDEFEAKSSQPKKPMEQAKCGTREEQKVAEKKDEGTDNVKSKKKTKEKSKQKREIDAPIGCDLPQVVSSPIREKKSKKRKKKKKEKQLEGYLPDNLQSVGCEEEAEKSESVTKKERNHTKPDNEPDDIVHEIQIEKCHGTKTKSSAEENRKNGREVEITVPRKKKKSKRKEEKEGTDLQKCEEVEVIVPKKKKSKRTKEKEGTDLQNCEEIEVTVPKKKKKSKRKKEKEGTDLQNCEEIEVTVPKKKKKSKRNKEKEGTDLQNCEEIEVTVPKKKKKSKRNKEKEGTDLHNCEEIEVTVPKKKKSKRNKENQNCAVGCEVSEELGDQEKERKMPKKHMKQKSVGAGKKEPRDDPDPNATGQKQESEPENADKKEPKDECRNDIDPKRQTGESKKTENREKENIARDIKDDVTVGQWGTAEFESEQRRDKFLRLLGGMKKKDENGLGNSKKSGLFGSLAGHKQNSAMTGREQATWRTNMVSEFDKAVMHRFQRGGGLGYEKPPEEGKKFHINISKCNSVKFDE